MTRKDYKLIAGVLSDIETQADAYFTATETIEKTAMLFASRLKLENSRFDKQKFLDACGVKC